MSHSKSEIERLLAKAEKRVKQMEKGGYYGTAAHQERDALLAALKEKPEYKPNKTYPKTDRLSAADDNKEAQDA